MTSGQVVQRKVSERLLNWASIIEPDTLAQAERTSRMPFVFPHVALMPDAHLGKGSTVGSVIPTIGAIMPAAIGVDIGCGMSACRLNVQRDKLPDDRRALLEAIEAAIPLGPGQYHETPHPALDEPITDLSESWSKYHPSQDGPPESPNWDCQLGTLGGGNHFIEISYDDYGWVWLVLHSGSRGVGNRIARRHIKIAQELADRWYIDLPDRDLAYLPQHSREFSTYIREMTWAQDFAHANRCEIARRVIDVFCQWAGRAPIYLPNMIHCRHNYTTLEHHFRKDLWVTRKGAIDAHQGILGIIPGSMGTESYIVEGLGNPASICSAPHGAGRAMSRRKARQQFSLPELDDAMGDIEFRSDEQFVDEIPAAYKPIGQIMEDSRDLVKVNLTLRQIVNVKGE